VQIIIWQITIFHQIEKEDRYYENLELSESEEE